MESGYTYSTNIPFPTNCLGYAVGLGSDGCCRYLVGQDCLMQS